jgi:PEP-CTERM motif
MAGKPQQFLTAFGLAGGLALACTSAHATFISDMTCGVSQCAEGTDFFIDNVSKDVQTFTGMVGSDLGPAITVETSANVDTGAGFATIAATTTLTALVFTPVDDTLFNGFSFRGQLAVSGFTGTIDVSWTDSNRKTGSITFTGVKGPDADFDRLGIVSNDGETLKLVTVSVSPSETVGESFKEFNQIEFSLATPQIPEPSTWAMMLLGFAGLGFAGYRQTRRAKFQAA